VAPAPPGCVSNQTARQCRTSPPGLVFGRQLRGVGDSLAHVDGTANVTVFEASPVGQVTITGPGAGPRLAGQGVLSGQPRSRAGGRDAHDGEKRRG